MLQVKDILPTLTYNDCRNILQMDAITVIIFVIMEQRPFRIVNTEL